MKKYDNFHSYLQNEFIISGIIDKFFIQFELGWKVLKELLTYEGNAKEQTGSLREIIKASFYCFDFMDEETWLSMLKDRNDCTHIYNKDLAKELVQNILERYIPEFQKMDAVVANKAQEE